MLIHPAIETAYGVLEGRALTYEEALALTAVEGNDILDLVSLANKVRDRFAPHFRTCSIINAKSGICKENCKFCAQAACHNTGIHRYPLLSAEELFQGAKAAWEAGVRSFGIVTSGTGYLKGDAPEFRQILDAMDLIHERLPKMGLCVSLGILSDETARLLAEHHADRYNMNLQTNPERYGELISDTHSIDAKIETIRLLKKYGVAICCGGIFGLGESWEDRVKMAFACRDLDVDGIPLNVLLPIPGTPLENRPVMQPAEVAKAFAIFRLVNPTRMIKFAAGRETTMKDFQGLLMLAGMNAIITGGYLTTRGRSVAEDDQFRNALKEFSSTCAGEC